MCATTVDLTLVCAFLCLWEASAEDASSSSKPMSAVRSSVR